MKKILFIFFISLTAISGFSQDIPAKPNPPRLVNDFAHVLSPEQVDILEHKLVALDDSTSNQIAVVLIKSLGDYAVEDYSVKLFRDWGIGNKKTNNGVLILASMDEHKIWITVGYGLEGAIPDAMASSIYRNEMVPEFKKGNYYRGIDNAVDALTKAAAGEYKEKRVREGRSSNGRSGGSIIGFIVIVIVIIIVSAIGRGGGGSGRGGMMNRSGFSDIATGMLLGSLLGGGRGGSSGWGGGGFGGGGGGGFGGFGGGSTGGGGAGGSW